MPTDDTEYCNIVNYILETTEFQNLKKFIHHGTSRYDHSLKVSYQAYKYAKKHNLDYNAVAIGGLLHDFFENSSNPTLKERFFATFDHSQIAVNNARDRFNVNELEADIISSHMFPINKKVPMHKESWIVSLYDKKIGMAEWACQFGRQISYATNLFLILVLNSIK